MKTHARVDRRVLQWVNKVRKEVQGKRPLTRLPKGIPASALSCPIHNCFAKEGDDLVEVCPETIYIDSPNSLICSVIRFPLYVLRFIEDFDNNKYPYLVKLRNDSEV